MRKHRQAGQIGQRAREWQAEEDSFKRWIDLAGRIKSIDYIQVVGIATIVVSFLLCVYVLLFL